MKREEIKAIYDMICPEWIEDNTYEVQDAFASVCKEALALYDRLNNAIVQIEPYHELCMKLNAENEKLKKKLDKYEKVSK